VNPLHRTPLNVEHALSPSAPYTTAANKERKANSSYIALLTAPMASLAGNVGERADVSFSAILGYN
jgi:hypothetical protein